MKLESQNLIGRDCNYENMSKFCRGCWKEFKGWCKSFTPTETLLAVIEGILLILFISFLVFLILHLMSCKGTAANDPPTTNAYPDSNNQTTPGLPEDESTPESTIPGPENMIHPDSTPTVRTLTGGTTIRSTKCTAVYPDETGEDTKRSTKSTANYMVTKVLEADYSADIDTPDTELEDGELASEEDRDVVIALVKIKPSGVTFGCILTVLSDHWTITAASCIDSIEEVDSLDSFVMVDNYGEAVKGRSHPVSDVKVHPLYEGRNKSYDLALLKSEDPLGRRPVVLPTMVDYFKITIGEKFDILGFGKFRSIDNSPIGKRVHSAAVHALPRRHCAGAALEARHLVPLGPVAHARCGAAPLCAGVLRARARPCNYCAGAPLLRRAQVRALLGVMGDNEACGGTCEPSLYADVARLAPWIQAVVDDK